MSLPLLLHELHARSSDVLLSQSPGADILVGNWSNQTVVGDPVVEKELWLRVVVAVVSFLSMTGAVLIILSYVCIRSIRTRSREILVHLSLADFGVACANFVGVVVDFDRYIRKCQTGHHDWCSDIHHLCTAQAFFAGFSTIASILWTLSLSVYIYLLVVHESRKLHSKVVYFCYLFCWGMPLLISLWLVLTGRLGHSAHGGSGWCTLKIEQESRSTAIFITVLGNDLWIYLTAVVVTILYLTTHCHIKEHVFLQSSRQSGPNNSAIVTSVDMKFLLIPLAFLLLRLGSMVVIIVYVYAQARPSRLVTRVLLCIAGIGDSGQGFVNAVLFCVFTAKVREKLRVGLARLHHCRCCLRHSYNYDLQYSTNTYSTSSHESQARKKVAMKQNA